MYTITKKNWISVFKEDEMKKIVFVVTTMMIFFPFSIKTTVEAEKRMEVEKEMQTEIAFIQRELSVTQLHIQQQQKEYAKIKAAPHPTYHEIKEDLVPPGTLVVSNLSTPRYPKPTPMFLPNTKLGETKPKLIPIEPLEHVYQWLSK
jgi:hypothetical protein